MDNNIGPQKNIENWQHFTATVRSSGCPLLKRLGDFHDPILVTGCQRSGTTMLANLLTESKGMVDYTFGYSLELAGALILSGFVDHAPSPDGRYCFQTTYLDDYYREYYEHQGEYKMIWVIRNPGSVVYSLLYNWPARSLEGTFNSYVASKMNKVDQWIYSLMGTRWINRVRQASWLYKVKNLQLLDLIKTISRESIFVVDYDDLVINKETVLPEIYRFIDIKYFPEYCQKINNKSVDKKKNLTRQELSIIKQVAEPIYQEICKFKNSH